MNPLATRSPHDDGVDGPQLVTMQRGMTTLFVASGKFTPGTALSGTHLFPRYSILPAMSLNGILHLAIQDCPYTAMQFNSFIEALLDNMNPSQSKIW